MKLLHGFLLKNLAWTVLGLAVAASEGKLSIPYVDSHTDAVRDMLWMAGVSKDDVVYDLGSGDGRIVIAAVRDFGARRAVGIEIDPNLVAESRLNAEKANVRDKVEFIQGDFFKTDFSQASVVVLFLGHDANIKLRPKLLGLKPGSRIVSHQFYMGEWPSDKAMTTRTVFLGMWGEQYNPFGNNPQVPDYDTNEMHYGTSDKSTLWIVPAPVAGVWRSKIETADGTKDCQLILHQQLSQVTGMLYISDKTLRVNADLWGDHIRFAAGLMEKLEIRFDGHVSEDAMQGTLAVFDNGTLQEYAWQARRDKTDLAGTWEWPCESLGRPVKLQIKQRESRYTATYLYGDHEIPVTDFYNFGGGFYFTYLIGRTEDGSREISKDTGWLIGEGIIDGGQMKGKVEFYPYPSPY